MAEIEGCACGKDHETMPCDTTEDGERYELVCRIHKRHEPCRACLWKKSAAVNQAEYLTWLREQA